MLDIHCLGSTHCRYGSATDDVNTTSTCTNFCRHRDVCLAAVIVRSVNSSQSFRFSRRSVCGCHVVRHFNRKSNPTFFYLTIPMCTSSSLYSSLVKRNVVQASSTNINTNQHLRVTRNLAGRYCVCVLPSDMTVCAWRLAFRRCDTCDPKKTLHIVTILDVNTTISTSLHVTRDRPRSLSHILSNNVV